MDIKETFKDCLLRKYDLRESRHIIETAHTTALAYLRMKVASGHLYMHNGEPLEDLAWDFIADLFERDSNNSFVVLEDIFSLEKLSAASTEEVELQFRKVIVTKVDDSIFRLNGEKDPSLKKIIRNLKNAIKKARFKDHIEIHDGHLIINNGQDIGENLLLSPTDILEIQLCRRIRGNMQMPEVLTEAVSILEEFRLHRNRISLVAIAICIRKAFIHINDENEDIRFGESPEEILHSQSFERRIDRSVESVKQKLGKKYIQKGSLKHRELNLYMMAVKKILYLEFVEKHAEANYYDCLHTYLPSMSYEDYRKNIRPLLEYLVKKTRGKIVGFYEKEWS